MAGGSLETAWELAQLFVLRPVLAVTFVLSFILLRRCWCTSRSCRRSPGCAGRSPSSPSPPTAGASPGSTSRKPRGTVNQKGPLKE
ncbi:uncharacterized protein [Triticum aestivum]|uniref:uncharacterized protein isoform X3 n=1 Tax=Triticum aestivum TaxID=4565 RepID=UPI000E7932FD|nr:uncharacterized protein LOC123047509 isoform X3 [Triticum aestivum]